MAEKLSKRRLDRLADEAAANPDRAALAWDTEVPGLFVRTRRAGLTFGFSYRSGGTERRMTLGRFGPLTLDQARDHARRLYGEVRSGGDPMADRRDGRLRGAMFSDVADLYLADLRDRAETGAKRGRRSTAADFAGRLQRSILPALGRLPLAAVDLGAVERMHRGLAKTPAMANRCLTITSAVLTFAERRGLRSVGSNPCRLVTRFTERPKAERFTLAELESLGATMREAEAEGENPAALLAVRLLALTGCRRSEVLAHELKARRPDAGGGLRWGDVNLAERTMFLRDAKSGDRLVPLGLAAVALLAAARPADAEDAAPVCPGVRPGAAIANLAKPWARLQARADLRPRGLHALRRTFASVAGDLGLGEYLIGALLGHSRAGVTGRYVIPSADPLRAAAEQVCSTIAAALSLAGNDSARVLSFGVERR